MFKSFVNEVKYSIYRMSVIQKVFFIIYIPILGIVLYQRGLEKFSQDLLFIAWMPGTIISSDSEKISEIYRLLPMSDREFKVWVVCKKLADGLVLSFLSAFASIPCAIKAGRPMLVFKLMITILIVSLWFGECMFKYRKERYPSIIFRISEFIIYIVLIILLTSDIRPYSAILDIIICILSLAVVAGGIGIRLYHMRNIHVSEMSFETTAEKR